MDNKKVANLHSVKNSLNDKQDIELEKKSSFLEKRKSTSSFVDENMNIEKLMQEQKKNFLEKLFHHNIDKNSNILSKLNSSSSMSNNTLCNNAIKKLDFRLGKEMSAEEDKENRNNFDGCNGNIYRVISNTISKEIHKIRAFEDNGSNMHEEVARINSNEIDIDTSSEYSFISLESEQKEEELDSDLSLHRGKEIFAYDNKNVKHEIKYEKTGNITPVSRDNLVKDNTNEWARRNEINLTMNYLSHINRKITNVNDEETRKAQKKQIEAGMFEIFKKTVNRLTKKYPEVNVQEIFFKSQNRLKKEYEKNRERAVKITNSGNIKFNNIYNIVKHRLFYAYGVMKNNNCNNTLMNDSRKRMMQEEYSYYLKYMKRRKTILSHFLPTKITDYHYITQIQFDATSQNIITIGKDGFLKIYHTSTGNLIFSMRVFRTEVVHFDIHKSNKYIAVCSQKGGIKVLYVDKYICKRVFHYEIRRPLHSVTFYYREFNTYLCNYNNVCMGINKWDDIISRYFTPIIDKKNNFFYKTYILCVTETSFVILKYDEISNASDLVLRSSIELNINNIKFFPYLKYNYSLYYNVGSYVPSEVIMSKVPIELLNNSYLVFVNLKSNTNLESMSLNNSSIKLTMLEELKQIPKKGNLNSFLLLATNKVYDYESIDSYYESILHMKYSSFSESHLLLHEENIEIIKTLPIEAEDFPCNDEDAAEVPSKVGKHKKCNNQEERMYQLLTDDYEINLLKRFRNKTGLVVFKKCSLHMEDIVSCVFSNTGADFVTVQKNGSIFLWQLQKYLNDVCQPLLNNNLISTREKMKITTKKQNTKNWNWSRLGWPEKVYVICMYTSLCVEFIKCSLFINKNRTKGEKTVDQDKGDVKGNNGFNRVQNNTSNAKKKNRNVYVIYSSSSSSVSDKSSECEDVNETREGKYKNAQAREKKEPGIKKNKKKCKGEKGEIFDKNINSRSSFLYTLKKNVDNKIFNSRAKSIYYKISKVTFNQNDESLIVADAITNKSNMSRPMTTAVTIKTNISVFCTKTFKEVKNYPLKKCDSHISVLAPNPIYPDIILACAHRQHVYLLNTKKDKIVKKFSYETNVKIFGGEWSKNGLSYVVVHNFGHFSIYTLNNRVVYNFALSEQLTFSQKFMYDPPRGNAAGEEPPPDDLTSEVFLLDGESYCSEEEMRLASGMGNFPRGPNTSNALRNTRMSRGRAKNRDSERMKNTNHVGSIESITIDSDETGNNFKSVYTLDSSIEVISVTKEKEKEKENKIEKKSTLKTKGKKIDNKEVIDIDEIVRNESSPNCLGSSTKNKKMKRVIDLEDYLDEVISIDDSVSLDEKKGKGTKSEGMDQKNKNKENIKKELNGRKKGKENENAKNSQSLWKRSRNDSPQVIQINDSESALSKSNKSNKNIEIRNIKKRKIKQEEKGVKKGKKEKKKAHVDSSSEYNIINKTKKFKNAFYYRPPYLRKKKMFSLIDSDIEEKSTLSRISENESLSFCSDLVNDSFCSSSYADKEENSESDWSEESLFDKRQKYVVKDMFINFSPWGQSEKKKEENEKMEKLEGLIKRERERETIEKGEKTDEYGFEGTDMKETAVHSKRCNICVFCSNCIKCKKCQRYERWNMYNKLGILKKCKKCRKCVECRKCQDCIYKENISNEKRDFYVNDLLKKILIHESKEININNFSKINSLINMTFRRFDDSLQPPLPHYSSFHSNNDYLSFLLNKERNDSFHVYFRYLQFLFQQMKEDYHINCRNLLLFDALYKSLKPELETIRHYLILSNLKNETLEDKIKDAQECHSTEMTRRTKKQKMEVNSAFHLNDNNALYCTKQHFFNNFFLQNNNEKSFEKRLERYEKKLKTLLDSHSEASKNFLAQKVSAIKKYRVCYYNIKKLQSIFKNFKILRESFFFDKLENGLIQNRFFIKCSELENIINLKKKEFDEVLLYKCLRRFPCREDENIDNYVYYNRNNPCMRSLRDMLRIYLKHYEYVEEHKKKYDYRLFVYNRNNVMLHMNSEVLKILKELQKDYLKNLNNRIHYNAINHYSLKGKNNKIKKMERCMCALSMQVRSPFSNMPNDTHFLYVDENGLDSYYLFATNNYASMANTITGEIDTVATNVAAAAVTSALLQNSSISHVTLRENINSNNNRNSISLNTNTGIRNANPMIRFYERELESGYVGESDISYVSSTSDQTVEYFLSDEDSDTDESDYYDSEYEDGEDDDDSDIDIANDEDYQRRGSFVNSYVSRRIYQNLSRWRRNGLPIFTRRNTRRNPVTYNNNNISRRRTSANRNRNANRGRRAGGNNERTTRTRNTRRSTRRTINLNTENTRNTETQRRRRTVTRNTSRSDVRNSSVNDSRNLNTNATNVTNVRKSERIRKRDEEIRRQNGNNYFLRNNSTTQRRNPYNTRSSNAT